MAVVIIKNARRGKLRLAFGVQLKPGLNEVEQSAWEMCREHPITGHYLTRGEIAVASEPRAVTPSVESPIVSNEGSDAARYVPESPQLPLVVEEAPAAPDEQPGVADSEPSGLPDFENLRAKDAVMALQSIDNVGDLRHLLRVESRSTVVRAIERRLADLGE